MEDQGARWEEFADGGGDGLAFPFGLASILEAKVVHVGGCKQVGDVGDAVSEGSTYIKCACVEVWQLSAGHGVYVKLCWVTVELVPSGYLAWWWGCGWVGADGPYVGWWGHWGGEA